MAKSTKTSGFDVDKFLQDEDEKARQQERNALIIEYSIPWNIIDNDPPFPGMKLNSCLVRWEPENVEEFIREHGKEVKRMMAEREAGRQAFNAKTERKSRGSKTTGTIIKNDETTNIKSSKSDSDQVTIITEMGNPSQQNGTTSEDVPMVKVASSDKSMQTKSPWIPKETDLTAPDTAPVETVNDIGVPPQVITATDTTIMTTTDKVGAQPNVADTPAVTGRATRISAKMRRASRQEFHDAYLVKTDTKGGKPITISANLIKRLYRICARSGDYRACPTYLVNNLLMEILDIIEPDTEGWADLD